MSNTKIRSLRRSDPTSVCSLGMGSAAKPTTGAKLCALADEIEQTGFANTTRLTVVKKWLNKPVRLRAVAVFIAQRTLTRGATSAKDQERELWDRSMDLFGEMDPVAERLDTKKATELLRELVAFQNQHEHNRWGAIRVIESAGLLIMEEAIRIMLEPDRPDLGYRLVADHLATYEPSHGPGLYAKSLLELMALARFVEDMEVRTASTKQGSQKR